MIRSEIRVGVSTASSLSSLLDTANPTPWMRSSSSAFPVQKNVKFCSVMELVSASLVSCRVAMSTARLASSRSISAVFRGSPCPRRFRSGSVVKPGQSVRMFQLPSRRVVDDLVSGE